MRFLYAVVPLFYLGCMHKRITLHFHDEQFLRSGRSDRCKRGSLSFSSPFHRCQLFNEVHTLSQGLGFFNNPYILDLNCDTFQKVHFISVRYDRSGRIAYREKLEWDNFFALGGWLLTDFNAIKASNGLVRNLNKG